MFFLSFQKQGKKWGIHGRLSGHGKKSSEKQQKNLMQIAHFFLLFFQKREKKLREIW